jgi:hypothetical protein
MDQVASRARRFSADSSSFGNFASNSTSEIPNAPAVALFGAPNAIIARTKRRSASREVEVPHFSAASASLSASTRGVIAFGFRPDPGLAPPRPIPFDFVISSPNVKSASNGHVFQKGHRRPSFGRKRRHPFRSAAQIQAATLHTYAGNWPIVNSAYGLSMWPKHWPNPPARSPGSHLENGLGVANALRADWSGR